MGYLIFGASGFIGSKIVDWLGSKKESVTIASKSLSSKKYKNIIEYSNLNIEDLTNLTSNYHTIIDASGISSNRANHSIDDYIKANSIWPSKLANVCIKNKTRLVWLSTIHCEKYENQIFTNDLYGFSKYIGEILIKNIPKWDENVLITRLGNVIGPPGNLYRGNSKLYALDIASNLVRNKKAMIKNDKDLEINTTSMSDFLNFIYEKNYGFENKIATKKFKLTELALLLKFHFEKLTKHKSRIFFKGEAISQENNLMGFSKNLNNDILDLLKFYIRKN